MVEERRQYVRRTPIAPLVVSLDQSRSALLLDVSEGGVALASIMPRMVDELITLSMELPESRGRLQARAEVAWTRESGHLSGVRFLDLDEPVRKQLNEWLWPAEEITSELEVAEQTAFVGPDPSDALEESSSAVAAAAEADPEIKAATENEDETEVEPQPANADLARQEVQMSGVEHPRDSIPISGWTGSLFPPITEGSSAAKTEEKGKYPVRLFFAVMLLSWALVFVGYRMGTKNEVSHTTEMAAAMQSPENAVDTASVSDSDAASGPMPKSAVEAPARTAVAEPGIDQPGFVLQVGAMKREGNADSLAQSLQRKKLPAFVFQHGDHFYRVAVGPFADPSSAARAKSTLEKNGLKAILRRWSPE